MTSYLRELTELQEEAERLSAAVLAVSRATVEQGAEAVRLEERLHHLREQLNDASEDEYDGIERLVYEIERNLTFVKAMAAPAGTDAKSRARAINRDSFDLALSLLDGTLAVDDCRVRADVLFDRLRKFNEDFPDADADTKRILAEAGQEIRYIQAGGKGTTTSRIAQIMRDRSAG